MSHSEPHIIEETAAEAMLVEYEQRVTSLGEELDATIARRDYWKRIVALEKGVNAPKVQYRAEVRVGDAWFISANNGLYSVLFGTRTACAAAIQKHGSREPVGVWAETVAELRETLERMLRALDAPALDYKTRKEVWPRRIKSKKVSNRQIRDQQNRDNRGPGR